MITNAPDLALDAPISRRTSSVFALVARIAAIIFALEVIIMGALSGWQLSWSVIEEGLTDATWLTVLSAPIIYLWVAQPFVRAAEDARRSLAAEVQAQATQARELESMVHEQRRLLQQNEELRLRLEDKSKEIAEVNERILQRIGADLHDGPAQLLAYALLRLGKVNAGATDAAPLIGCAQLGHIRSALSDALREIRNTSTGLSDPRLEGADLEQTVLRAIAMHEEHTGSKVALFYDEPPFAPSHSTRLCIFRFVQEGLTNAFRHAGGKGQRIVVGGTDSIEVEVIDSGPGYDVGKCAPGLGLTGMRTRIEALGGRLSIASSPSGTVLAASFGKTTATRD